MNKYVLLKPANESGIEARFTSDESLIYVKNINDASEYAGYIITFIPISGNYRKYIKNELASESGEVTGLVSYHFGDKIKNEEIKLPGSSV